MTVDGTSRHNNKAHKEAKAENKVQQHNKESKPIVEIHRPVKTKGKKNKDRKTTSFSPAKIYINTGTYNTTAWLFS